MNSQRRCGTCALQKYQLRFGQIRLFEASISWECSIQGMASAMTFAPFAVLQIRFQVTS
jgi:hypothetical protein